MKPARVARWCKRQDSCGARDDMTAEANRHATKQKTASASVLKPKRNDVREAALPPLATLADEQETHCAGLTPKLSGRAGRDA
jgi:hypothetical protein